MGHVWWQSNRNGIENMIKNRRTQTHALFSLSFDAVPESESVNDDYRITDKRFLCHLAIHHHHSDSEICRLKWKRHMSYFYCTESTIYCYSIGYGIAWKFDFNIARRNKSARNSLEFTFFLIGCPLRRLLLLSKDCVLRHRLCVCGCDCVIAYSFCARMKYQATLKC